MDLTPFLLMWGKCWCTGIRLKPHDLRHLNIGTFFRTMEGPVNTIETYLSVTTPPDETGAMINFATWQSAIYGYAMAHELKPIRKVLFPEKLPSLKPKLAKRGNLHQSKLVHTWVMPFPGSDRYFFSSAERQITDDF